MPIEFFKRSLPNVDRTLVVTLILLCVLLTYLDVAFAKSPKIPLTIKGFALDMIGSANNRYKVYLAANMVRIKNLVTGCNTISKGPDWDVSMWHDSTKQICHITYKEWCEHQIWPYSWPADLGKPIKTKRFTSNGQNHILYEFGTTIIIDPLFRSEMGKKKGLQDKNHAEIDCIDYPAAPKAGGVLSRMQGLPPLAGFPVSAVRFRESGRREAALQLTSRWEESDIDKTLFDAPIDYKSVKFTVDFVQGERRSGDMKDFATQMWK